MASVLNISAYLFTRLHDAHALRPLLRERAHADEALTPELAPRSAGA